MGTRTKPKSLSEWKLLIEAQEQSQQTQKIFCEQQNISLSQFIYRRSIIKSKEKVKEGKKLFTEIGIKQSELPKSYEIKILLPNGFQCVVPSGVETDRIKRLMEVLLSC